VKKENPFKLFGIFGHPLSHTLSPAMQEAGFEKAGLKAFYCVCELAPADFKKAFRGIKNFHLDGFNVTVPYKQTVMPYLKKLMPEAKAVGAVNTVFRRGKIWTGTNTDVYGFLTALEKEGGFLSQGKTALVLGAGGAARAVIYGLASRKADRILIANRHEARAKKLARDFRNIFPRTNFETLSLKGKKIKEALREADLVVNSTSVGLRSSDAPLLSSDWIPKRSGKQKLFFDLIYHVPVTSFMKAARKKGHRALGGLGMLLHQGAKAFEYWTGRKAPVETMRRALSEALKAHQGKK
jgi:shikimate dehydrogenase